MVEEITLKSRDVIYTLTQDCVIHLHDLLSKNYHLVDKMDPVEPPGVKDIHMLASAVFRQKTGTGEWLKYNNVFNNCATLIFGLINNHPFFNGNKRVAFLAMIKHLFENGYVIKPKVKHDDIYNVLVSIADNKFSQFLSSIDPKLYKQVKVNDKWSDEKQIDVLAQWIRKISASKHYCIKSEVRLQKMKEILQKKGIYTELNGTWLTLYQLKDRKILGLFNAGKEQTNIKKYSVGNSLSEIGIKTINQIRKDYDLTHSRGFDNNSFYDSDTFVDQEMVTYKRIIYKLSQT